MSTRRRNCASVSIDFGVLAAIWDIHARVHGGHANVTVAIRDSIMWPRKHHKHYPWCYQRLDLTDHGVTLAYCQLDWNYLELPTFWTFIPTILSHFVGYSKNDGVIFAIYLWSHWTQGLPSAGPKRSDSRIHHMSPKAQGRDFMISKPFCRISTKSLPLPCCVAATRFHDLKAICFHHMNSRGRAAK